MEIYPNSGIGEIKFGMLRKDVDALLGVPDDIREMKVGEFILSEDWIYESLGLEFTFDADTDYRCKGCSITTRSAQLNGKALLGLTRSEVLRLFPNFIDNTFEITDSETDMYMSLVDNVVRFIHISANISDFIYEYSSKSYKRMVASKRLIKKSIRRNECAFVSQLMKYWNCVDEQNIPYLENDLKWFLSGRLALGVYPESKWCDGAVIHSISFESDKLLYINGTADVLSSEDDSFYQVCDINGFIMLNNKRDAMKKYRIDFKYESNVYVAKKACKTVPLMQALRSIKALRR